MHIKVVAVFLLVGGLSLPLATASTHSLASARPSEHCTSECPTVITGKVASFTATTLTVVLGDGTTTTTVNFPASLPIAHAKGVPSTLAVGETVRIYSRAGQGVIAIAIISSDAAPITPLANATEAPPIPTSATGETAPTTKGRAGTVTYFDGTTVKVRFMDHAESVSITLSSQIKVAHRPGTSATLAVGEVVRVIHDASGAVIAIAVLSSPSDGTHHGEGLPPTPVATPGSVATDHHGEGKGTHTTRHNYALFTGTLAAYDDQHPTATSFATLTLTLDDGSTKTWPVAIRHSFVKVPGGRFTLDSSYVGQKVQVYVTADATSAPMVVGVLVGTPGDGER